MHVFLSRDIDKSGALFRFCEAQKIKLTAQALIEFKPKQTPIPEKVFEVVFFASPRAFEFFEAKEALEGKVLACVGEQTKKYLQKAGFEVEFVGDNATDPEQIGRDFMHWLQKRSVLFPLSSQSRKTISQFVPEDQKIELVVYETLSNPVKFKEKFDVLVFSSPTNAEAYLLQNEISIGQRLVCFGKTTQAYLENQGLRANILNSPDEAGLVAYLKDTFFGQSQK